MPLLSNALTYDICKTGLDFILLNLRYLKIIKLHLPLQIQLEPYNQIKLQTKKALLGLQKRDNEEKIIILYRLSNFSEKITLPWPPI